MNSLTTKILNLVLYQVGWFCCVLGAAKGYPLAGALAALALVGVHLLLTSCRRQEFILLLAVCLLGGLVDSLQQALGVLRFQGSANWPLWLPLWVFIIWAQFATLLRFSLNWLSGRYWLASLLGLIGGPLAYWGGVRLGAAEFEGSLLLSLASLALVWGVMMPLLLWMRSIIAAEQAYYRGPLPGGCDSFCERAESLPTMTTFYNARETEDETMDTADPMHFDPHMFRRR